MKTAGNQVGWWKRLGFKGFGPPLEEAPQPPVEPPDGPLLGEAAWSDGLFFGRVPMERWNPDGLVAGRGYALYRKMLRDDQIKGLIQFKTAVITQRGWHFRVEPGVEGQQECAAFLTHLLEKGLQGTFSSALSHLLSSQSFGFSVTEKVYRPMEWRGQTYWGVAALKARPVESFTFQSDGHGNLTGLFQYQGGKRVALEPGRFILHVNRPESDPLYGESDLSACHRHWWSKENILKFWNIYLERMAAGFVHGRVSGPLTPVERDELRQVMKNLSSQTSIITPASVELDMVTAPSTDAFERAVAARDKAMAKALLVPNLLGLSEQGQTGSYSQSQTQMESFLLVMNALADSVADVLNEQLFRPLAWWNWGLSEPPLFCFDPLSESQKREMAKGWGQAVGQGVVANGPADEAHTRRLLGYPLGETSYANGGDNLAE